MNEMRTPYFLALLPIAGVTASCAKPRPISSGSECSCKLEIDGDGGNDRDVTAEAMRGACVERSGSAYRVRGWPPHSASVAVPSALLDARSACGVFWVRGDGRAVRTPVYDNGADYFCDGLVRYLVDGKYGYVNAALAVVVAARYDFAYPFQGGHGAVCQGCTTTPDGEHTIISCARCGAVDRRGVLVVPVTHSAAQIEALFPGDPDRDCSVTPPEPRAGPRAKQ